MNNKIISIIVVIIVILNTAALVVLWRKSVKQPGKEPFATPAQFLIEKVGFDAAQQSDYNRLIEKHRDKSEPLKRELTVAKHNYFQMIGSNTSDSSRTAMLQTINTISDSLHECTFQHFESVRKICNPNQQKIFDATIREVIERMQRNKPAPPPESRE